MRNTQPANLLSKPVMQTIPTNPTANLISTSPLFVPRLPGGLSASSRDLRKELVRSPEVFAPRAAPLLVTQRVTQWITTWSSVWQRNISLQPWWRGVRLIGSSTVVSHIRLVSQPSTPYPSSSSLSPLLKHTCKNLATISLLISWRWTVASAMFKCLRSCVASVNRLGSSLLKQWLTLECLRFSIANANRLGLYNLDHTVNNVNSNSLHSASLLSTLSSLWLT